MVGRHEFVAGIGGVMGCKHCGETEEYLDARRGADGKLPPCLDAPDEQTNTGELILISVRSLD